MRAVVLLCLSALAFSACKKKPSEDAARQAAAEAGCALQTPCALDGVTATVIAVTDSRCPRDARCMWAGDASVTVKVGEQTLELHSNTEVGEAQVPLPGGGTLRLEEVLPYPDVSGPPADADWRVKLQVTP